MPGIGRNTFCALGDLVLHSFVEEQVKDKLFQRGDDGFILQYYYYSWSVVLHQHPVRRNTGVPEVPFTCTNGTNVLMGYVFRA